MAAAAHAGPGLGNMTADAAAAAGRAASCSRGPMTAGAAMMHQQLADSSRQLPEHVRNSALYQAYDRPSSTAPGPSRDSSLQSPFPRGFRHSSQAQAQALQAGLQYGQDGRSAAAAAASCHDVSPSTWELGSCSSQSGAVHHQSRLFEADLSKSDSQQSRTDSGRSVHDGWAGQRQGMPGGDPPLDAAQYDAVAALQSLALQLQATGKYHSLSDVELTINATRKRTPIKSNPLAGSGLLTSLSIAFTNHSCNDAASSTGLLLLCCALVLPAKPSSLPTLRLMSRASSNCSQDHAIVGHNNAESLAQYEG